MADPAVNRRGILATLAAVTMWTFNDACGKLASEVFPAGQMMTIRSVFAIPLCLALVTYAGHGRGLWHTARRALAPIVLVRAVLDALVVLCFYEALSGMQLANITAISQATPIILAFLAAALGIERIGWRRLLAILVGFGGVLVIVKPTSDGLTIYAGLAVLASAFVAVRDIVTRYVDPATPSSVMALATAVITALIGLGCGLFEPWQPLLLFPTLALMLAAVFVTFGNVLIVIAYRATEMGVVAPFRYFSIVVALLLGLVLFGNFPDGLTIAGIALIVGSGVYTWHRERVRQREAEALEGAAIVPAMAAAGRKGGRAAWTAR